MRVKLEKIKQKNFDWMMKLKVKKPLTKKLMKKLKIKRISIKIKNKT
jgi:hypothetical protein